LKKDHWEDFLDQINEKTVWTAHKLESMEAIDGGGTRVPTWIAKRENGET